MQISSIKTNIKGTDCSDLLHVHIHFICSFVTHPLLQNERTIACRIIIINGGNLVGLPIPELSNLAVRSDNLTFSISPPALSTHSPLSTN